MNVTTISIKAAAQAIKAAFAAKTLPPFVHGSPGIGKSAIAKQIARELDLFFIDVRLSDREPTDLSGLPGYTADRKKATYLPFEEFPIAGDALPINPLTGQPHKGFLVMLDEFSNALPAVQSAAYKFTLDRKVGIYDLHPDCYVMAAGNLESDGALAQPMSTALISRFVNLYVKPDLDEWIEAVGAKLKNVDIMAFLAFRTEQFYTFSAELTTPYASPRTWEEVDTVMTTLGSLDPDTRKVISTPLLEGLIGKAAVADFRTFLEVKKDIISFSEIVKNPITAPVPSANNLGLMWATAFMVVERMTIETINQCADYLDRFPREIQAATARGALTRHNHWLEATPDGRAYKTRVFRKLFR